MYCRKCGAEISNSAKFCDSCGEQVKVIKQRSDAQKFDDRRKLEQSQKKEKKAKKSQREKKLEELKNPYVIPAFATAVLAFGLGIFPWPRSWEIGTSLWMRVAIVLIALLSDYHCTKAKQVNRLYDIQYRYQVRPKMLTVATVLATITTAISLYALFGLGI